MQSYNGNSLKDTKSTTVEKEADILGKTVFTGEAVKVEALFEDSDLWIRGCICDNAYSNQDMDNLLRCLDKKVEPVTCVLKHLPTWFTKATEQLKTKNPQYKDKEFNAETKKAVDAKLLPIGTQATP